MPAFIYCFKLKHGDKETRFYRKKDFIQLCMLHLKIRFVIIYTSNETFIHLNNKVQTNVQVKLRIKLTD